jgi:hypothetical protein
MEDEIALSVPGSDALSAYVDAGFLSDTRSSRPSRETLWQCLSRSIPASTLGDVVDQLAAGVPQRIRRIAGHVTGVPIPRYLRASNHLFIHIPKTGGVSISQAIYGRQVWHRTALFFQDCDPDFLSTRLSFAVVRNPWDRLVSAYEFCRGGGTKLAQLKMAPPRPLLETFTRFVLDYVLPNKDRLNSLDEVLREQHGFINDLDGKCLVNFVGRFEDLGTFEEMLLRRKVLRRPISHLNGSPGRVHKDYKPYYAAPELVEAVATCYASDIREYSYQFE